MVKAIGLISGGLDSLLACLVLREQGIEIEGVSFVTPFFSSKNAERGAQEIGIPLHVIDITEPHLHIVKSPRYGYGKEMNPCIDCHILMFKEAGKFMEEKGADFLFTGEVLGERPMSQNKKALLLIAKESGYGDVLLRPLSAKLLPPTEPEKQGKVDRKRLLDIKGRSRKRQMELAQKYGLKEYPSPAGGCLLTEPGFCRRLKDLFSCVGDFKLRDIELLKIGRHIRLDDKTKLIVGRNKMENQMLKNLRLPEDDLFFVPEYPSPVGLIPYGTEDYNLLLKAASICVRYSDSSNEQQVKTICQKKQSQITFKARALADEILREMII